jgi:hypothetical protein
VTSPQESVTAGRGARMTRAEARDRYSFAADPAGWHYQPVCICGDYILQHEELPPHRCGFSRRPSDCQCFRYRFARLGSGPAPEDRERWEKLTAAGPGEDQAPPWSW